MAEAIFGKRDRYSCAVCLDLLMDPVTIPCGHNYCMTCIDTCWNNMGAQKGFYSCPQCRQTYHSRPSLNRNTVLAEIMEQLRGATTTQVSESAESLAGPGDIACDFCHGRKFKAVKSCHECQVSYCEEHVHPHYNVPALKKHKLVKPYIMTTCSKHDKLLEVYCRTDQKSVCMHCLMDDHKGHDTVPSATERNEKQIKLANTQKKLKQTIQEKEKELQKMTNDIKSHSHSAKKAVKDSVRAFTELVRLIETSSTEVTEKIKAHKKADLDEGSNLKEKLTVEITELKKRDGVLETLLQTEDNIHFLQHFESVASSSESEFPSLSFKPRCSFMDASKLVCELKGRLEAIFNEEINNTSKKVSDLAIKSSAACVKIGDKVRVKPSVLTPKHDWGNVTHTSVGVVKDIKDDGSVAVNFPGHADWKGILSEIQLATDDDDECDNSVFKPGSKVRVKASVTTPKFGWGDVTKNSIGIVTAVEDDAVTVDFPENLDWTGMLSEMELVGNCANHDTDKTSFQTGSRVRVKASVETPEYGWGDVTKNSIGIVKAVLGGELTVDFPEHSGWTGIMSELELVPDDYTDTLSLSPGMRVRVKPSIHSPIYGWGSLTKDSIGVVKAIDGTKVTVHFPEQSEWRGIISEMEAV